MQTERLPKTSVTIEGATYQLCGSFEALIAAEAYFALRIYDFSLANVLVSWGENRESLLKGARTLFPCALRTFHPDVTDVDAQGMFDRAITRNDMAILNALWTMWPAETPEAEAANQNLRCDLESLAEANAFFEGKPGLALICVEGRLTLDHVWRIWPCAVHHFRPELSLDQARGLMTMIGLRVIVRLWDFVNSTASQEARDLFAQRVAAVATEQDKQDVLFRLAAKRQWPGENNVN
jgi:hypothetical protein